MTPANAAQLQQMMVAVVSNGTGRNAQISGVEVGGKTGTAQSDPKRKPFAWFTSFAPVDDPKVAVAVIVEDADIPREDIAGGRLAAPIAGARKRHGGRDCDAETGGRPRPTRTSDRRVRPADGREWPGAEKGRR